MTESFGQSFHFASRDVDALKTILEKAGMTGRLWGPSRRGWIFFQPFGDCPRYRLFQSGFAEHLAHLSGAATLEWAFGGFDDWYVELWKGGERWARYHYRSLDSPPVVETDDDSIARFLSLADGPAAQAVLNRTLLREIDDASLTARPSNHYLFARTVGLLEARGSMQLFDVDKDVSEDPGWNESVTLETK